jgi:hypothetical protein
LRIFRRNVSESVTLHKRFSIEDVEPHHGLLGRVW